MEALQSGFAPSQLWGSGSVTHRSFFWKYRLC